ncbi:MAG: NRAMP family divalent metal transporter [Flavitalea sp.]
MKNKNKSPLLGAAFLMATSAIGPGFLTQTTVFTEQLAASFGFAILVSIILDIAAQLNIWRVITIAEMPAQQIANRLLPGLGYMLTLLIVFGGLAFNIGNIAGAGLGMNVMFDIDPVTGAVISCFLSIGVFMVKEATIAMDFVAKLLGFLMIGLTLYVAWRSQPPLAMALKETIIPARIELTSILAIVGGTVGGYITFAGAHRLLDAGVKGKASIPDVNRSAITAISLASVMRILLFLAALGVVMTGARLDPSNPAASMFRIAAGEVGYRLFGIVLWSAALTSVIGSAYTSISFMRDFHPLLLKYQRFIIIGFIRLSTGIFVWIGQPVTVLLLAGALNGLILPVALAIMLIAAHKSRIVGDYRHPIWMSVLAILVILTMTYIGTESMISSFGKL